MVLPAGKTRREYYAQARTGKLASNAACRLRSGQDKRVLTAKPAMSEDRGLQKTGEGRKDRYGTGDKL